MLHDLTLELIGRAKNGFQHLGKPTGDGTTNPDTNEDWIYYLMKPQSCKAKGRKLQQMVRDLILEIFPELKPDDVRSTAMGQNGEDVQLSTAARQLLPFQIECKNKKEVAVINWLKQASTHGNYTPILIAKQNYSDPVVVIDAKTFFQWVKTWKYPPQ